MGRDDSKKLTFSLSAPFSFCKQTVIEKDKAKRCKFKVIFNKNPIN
jgi:hypothetical protein